MYQHHWLDGSPTTWPAGKVVCVGRNYAAHARELNNPVPTEPILFLKPATAMAFMAEPLQIPANKGAVHFETEMALLIGKPLTCASESEALAAIAGVGIGFDLTLRELQDQLKTKGYPWETAKAFDGSCPLSAFLPIATKTAPDWANIDIAMYGNGDLRQQGNSGDMLTPVARLLAHISTIFTLLPGDVVMTGTPAGVGPLHSGDQLTAQLSYLGQQLISTTAVVAA